MEDFKDILLGGLLGYFLTRKEHFEKLKKMGIDFTENFTTKPFDLTQARDKEEVKENGNYIYVLYLDGEATIILNEPNNKEIELKENLEIKTPFYRFFLTNSAQPGKKLKLLIGRAGYETNLAIANLIEAIKNLTSNLTPEKQGIPLFWSIFDKNIINFLTSVDSGGDISLTNATGEVYTKQYSLKLTTPATTNGKAKIYVHLPVGFLSAFKKLRLSFKTKFMNLGAGALYVKLSGKNNPKEIAAGIAIQLDLGSSSGSDIFYINENNSWVSTLLMPPGNSNTWTKQWNEVILELDLENYVYGYCAVNYKSLEMQNKNFYVADTEDLTTLLLEIWLQTYEDASRQVLLSDIELKGYEYTTTQGILNPAPVAPTIIIG